MLPGWPMPQSARGPYQACRFAGVLWLRRGKPATVKPQFAWRTIECRHRHPAGLPAIQLLCTTGPTIGTERGGPPADWPGLRAGAWIGPAAGSDHPARTESRLALHVGLGWRIGRLCRSANRPGRRCSNRPAVAAGHYRHPTWPTRHPARLSGQSVCPTAPVDIRRHAEPPGRCSNGPAESGLLWRIPEGIARVAPLGALANHSG